MAFRSESEKKQQKYNAEKKESEDEKYLFDQSFEITDVHDNYEKLLKNISHDLNEQLRDKRNLSVYWSDMYTAKTQSLILHELVSIRAVLEKIESKLVKEK
jgi:hypothetical protein